MADPSRSSNAAQRELPLAEAARFLNVTLAFIVQQVGAGQLPTRETGRGKVIPMDALRIYRQNLHRETDDALQALADQGQELGI